MSVPMCDACSLRQSAPYDRFRVRNIQFSFFDRYPSRANPAGSVGSGTPPPLKGHNNLTNNFSYPIDCYTIVVPRIRETKCHNGTKSLTSIHSATLRFETETRSTLRYTISLTVNLHGGLLESFFETSRICFILR